MQPAKKSAGLTDAGFWRRFWSGIAGRQTLEPGDRVHPFDSHTSAAGSSVSVDSALKLSAVWACVGLRSATIASLPLHLRDTDKKLATEEPLYRLLHDDPNADMTSSEFLEAQVSSIDLWGNAYSHIERDKGRVVALTPIPSDRVTIHRRDDRRIRFEVKRKGRTEEFDEDDIIHFKGFTLDGYTGLSPIQYHAETMGGLMDANRAANLEWKNGMRVGNVISTPTLTDDQRRLFKLRLREHEGAENAGKNMLLEKPFEIVKDGGTRLNPVDAQLLESRMHGAQEVCQAFRVPPQLIGITDKASSWASSLENTNLGFLQYSIRPTLIRIEKRIKKQLMTADQRAKYDAKFSIAGLLRADTTARAALYASALQNAWMSRNEVRRLEDLPDIEGGDIFTLQLNLARLDQLGMTPAPADEAKRAFVNWLRDGAMETV